MERIDRDFVGREVSNEQLSAVLAQLARIDGYITETFNELYLRQKQVEPLTGFTLLVGKIIHKYIDYTLRYDMKRAPFFYLRSEDLICNHLFTRSNGTRSVQF